MDTPKRSLGPVIGAGILGLAIAACGGSGSTAGDGSQSGGFIATVSDFDGFHSWSSATATSQGDDAGDGLHGIGPLRVYWNKPPPHGSTTFPNGTIIVKETEETDVTKRMVFAMVKRGDGFNSGGTNGWEWFSLDDQADGTVDVLWRGVLAPSGETYSNQPIGDCNGCHTQAASNDGVWDTALQLSKF